MGEAMAGLARAARLDRIDREWAFKDADKWSKADEKKDADAKGAKAKK